MDILNEDDWLERNASVIHDLFNDWIEHNAAANFAATQEALGYTAATRRAIEQPSRPPRARARKPSLARALSEAKEVGVNVAAATITGEGVALTFGEAAKSSGNELDQWMEKHKNAN